MPNATTTDAELILHLYQLRTEEVMRKARGYVVGELWPQSAEDLQKVTNSFGSQENAYWRQAITYWEMAASFVLRGAVNEDIFCDNAGELFFLYGKFQPFVKKMRETNPLFFQKFESVVNLSKETQERADRAGKTAAALSAVMAAKA